MGAARGNRIELPVPTGDASATRPAISPPIARSTLQEMYRRELGSAYDPVQADDLESAHQLLERFFLAQSAGERREIGKSLASSKVDANVLGRLTRIRSHWPDLSSGGIFYINQKNGRYVVRYFLGVPKGYDRTKPWPLLVKLADAGEFIRKPPTDASQVVSTYTGWIKDELARHSDTIILMPLLDLDEQYGPSYAGMNDVMQSLFDAADRCNVDPARVYLSGFSLGAIGAWYVALDYPTYFASIESLAGAAPAEWEQLRLMNLRNVLPVIWHDSTDTFIKVGFSRTLVKKLQQEKVQTHYEETRGLDHHLSRELLDRNDQAMRSRTRNLYPGQVWVQTNRPDVLFNRNDWVQIYQELAVGKEHRVYFRRGTAHMSTYENFCFVKADLHANQIDVSSDNVDVMRFYLNDQMVNLAAPVTVRVNRKVKFKGVVKPSLELMLADQLFLGRGWRYYTGAIDIEMTSTPATNPATRPAARPTRGNGRITTGPAR